MKIDAYVLFLEHPSRFGLKIRQGWGEHAGEYLKVVALPEMDDEQVLRLVLDNISYLLKRLDVAGATVNVHIDLRHSTLFWEDLSIPHGIVHTDDKLLQESIDRLRAFLAGPGDLQFQHDPDGGSMI